MSASARLARFAHRVWSGKGITSTLLLPLSWLTGLAVARKRQRYQRHPNLTYRSPLPVVVVGNLFVGGTGKTPVVIAIVQALQAHGWRPGVISRGYGVPASDTPRHGQGQLDPARFGDEPALIARETGVPVAVHPARVQALRALEMHYPDVDVVVSDDGLQHLALGRDVEIVVQDGRGCGNGRLLPAGPLREPASRLAEVDFLITQQDAPPVQDAGQAKTLDAVPFTNGNLPSAAPVERQADVSPAGTVPASHAGPLRIVMALVPDTLKQLTSGSVLSVHDWKAQHAQATVSAVAGIGNPQRFFDMLQRAGIPLAHAVAMPDHDDFRQPPFGQLPQGPILITPKDAVKCAGLQDDRLWVVQPQTRFTDPRWLEVLEGRLRQVQWQHRQDESMPRAD